MPALLVLTIALLGRSFYSIYFQNCGTRTNKIITWASAFLAAGFWTWMLVSGQCFMTG